MKRKNGGERGIVLYRSGTKFRSAARPASHILAASGGYNIKVSWGRTPDPGASNPTNPVRVSSLIASLRYTKVSCWRRERDSNPRWDEPTPDFESGAFDQLGHLS